MVQRLGRQEPTPSTLADQRPCLLLESRFLAAECLATHCWESSEQEVASRIREPGRWAAAKGSAVVVVGEAVVGEAVAATRELTGIEEPLPG